MNYTKDGTSAKVVRQGQVFDVEPILAGNSYAGRSFLPQRWRVAYQMDQNTGTWRLASWKVYGGMIKKNGQPGEVTGEFQGYGELSDREEARIPWFQEIVATERPVVEEV